MQAVDLGATTNTLSHVTGPIQYVGTIKTGSYEDGSTQPHSPATSKRGKAGNVAAAPASYIQSTVKY